MKIRDLRNELRQLLHVNHGAVPSAAIEEVLTIWAEFDDMQIAEFFRLLRPRNKSGATSGDLAVAGVATKPPAKRRPPAIDLTTTARGLAAVLGDDSKFDDELEAVVNTPGVTKPTLLELYKQVFGEEAILSSKASKPDIVRAIRNERIVRARNQNMDAMLGRKPAPAE